MEHIYWIELSLFCSQYICIYICHYLNQCWPTKLTSLGVTNDNFTNFRDTSFCGRDGKKGPYYIFLYHYSDVIIGAMASQITSVSIAYSAVRSGADQRKHQSSASLAFAMRIHWWPANSPHKGPVTKKVFPCDEVIMTVIYRCWKSTLWSQYELTHTRPRDMARSRPPFWIFSFAAWKWVNMDGNWRNFDGNISSYACWWPSTVGARTSAGRAITTLGSRIYTGSDL